jgi:E3 ubiquitin-protein ligase HERC4
MWMRLLETRHFNRIVQFLMNCVEFLFNKDHRNHEKFLPALNILNELSQVNKTSNRIPFEKFYLNSLGKKVDVRQDYMESYAAKHPEQFSNQGRKADGGFWSNYPFLFNAEAKVAILEADSVLRMQVRETRLITQ